MSTSRYTPTERIGVNSIEALTVTELGWIFREQPIVDMGIDAHVELVDAGSPRGRLIALQIKTGPSHFADTEDALIYYGKLEHLDYWTNHSLPVILVAHLPDAKATYWVAVTEQAVTRTAKGWKISIPKSNLYGNPSRKQLMRLFEGTAAQQKLRLLAIHEPLMRHVHAGRRVSVDLEDWVNKSLGRTPVKVYVYDADGEETLSMEWFQFYTGYSPEELAEVLFPWAKVSIDDEFYELHADPHDWMSPDSGPDEDGDDLLPDPEPAIYPYADASGEVECYRLQLHLNDLGRAYLVVANHLNV